MLPCSTILQVNIIKDVSSIQDTITRFENIEYWEYCLASQGFRGASCTPEISLDGIFPPSPTFFSFYTKTWVLSSLHIGMTLLSGLQITGKMLMLVNTAILNNLKLLEEF